jgi:hypothetical protein
MVRKIEEQGTRKSKDSSLERGTGEDGECDVVKV